MAEHLVCTGPVAVSIAIRGTDATMTPDGRVIDSRPSRVVIVATLDGSRGICRLTTDAALSAFDKGKRPTMHRSVALAGDDARAFLRSAIGADDAAPLLPLVGTSGPLPDGTDTDALVALVRAASTRASGSTVKRAAVPFGTDRKPGTASVVPHVA